MHKMVSEGHLDRELFSIIQAHYVTIDDVRQKTEKIARAVFEEIDAHKRQMIDIIA